MDSPDKGNDSFIDLNHKIKLPKDFDANSQIVKLRISVPKIILVTPDKLSENTTESYTPKRTLDEDIDHNAEQNEKSKKINIVYRNSSPKKSNYDSSVLEKNIINTKEKNHRCTIGKQQSKRPPQNEFELKNQNVPLETVFGDIPITSDEFELEEMKYVREICELFPIYDSEIDYEQTLSAVSKFLEAERLFLDCSNHLLNVLEDVVDNEKEERSYNDASFTTKKDLDSSQGLNSFDISHRKSYRKYISELQTSSIERKNLIEKIGAPSEPALEKNNTELTILTEEQNVSEDKRDNEKIKKNDFDFSVTTKMDLANPQSLSSFKIPYRNSHRRHTSEVQTSSIEEKYLNNKIVATSEPAVEKNNTELSIITEKQNIMNEGLVTARIKYFESPISQKVALETTEKVSQPETETREGFQLTEEIEVLDDEKKLDSPASQNIQSRVRDYFNNREYKTVHYSKSLLLMEPRPKSSFEGFQRYLEQDCQNKDSEIVKSLVLSKYSDALRIFLEKSGKRRRFSFDCIHENDNESIDSGQDSICHDLIEMEEEGMFLPCNVSASTSCNDISRKNDGEESENQSGAFNSEENKSKETLRDYNEKVFLNMALGSEFGNSTCTLHSDNSNPPRSLNSRGEDDSIGTSHLSQLISVDSSEGSKKNHDSITYCSVRCLNQSKGNIGTFSIISTTEEREDFTDYLQTELEKVDATIRQVSKALDLCGRIRNFNSSVERVEAESILLASTLHKELILEKISNKIKANEQSNPRSGVVKISNIRIPLTRTTQAGSKYSRCFVCILHCGSALFSSGLILPNDGDLVVKKIFRFEKLRENFEINIEIYSMYAKMNKRKQKKKNCTHQAFHNVKQLISPRRVSQTEDLSIRKSSFLLYGKTVISRPLLQEKEFHIQKTCTGTSLANNLTCDIDVVVNLTNMASGFLTVGEFKKGLMLWNRQWCVLNAHKLQFWDYPEQEKAPNKIIDISRSLLPSISQADKSTCSRPRTLYMEIENGSSTSENLYLSADSQEDFIKWKSELNAVLTVLIQWGIGI